VSYTQHYSVLKREILDFFSWEKKECHYFADLTFGGGGHSFAILENHPQAKLFSVDQDPDALKNGNDLREKNNLTQRLTLLSMNFEEFPEYYAQELSSKGIKFDGILMDLGVSSHHFDQDTRGFSFRHDGPLDMRMDLSEKRLTAKDLVNDLDFDSLTEIFFNYGEEGFAKRIAERIIEERKLAPIETTGQLEQIVFHAYPKKLRFGRLHPATKTFQALRIAVNDELGVLEKTLPRLYDLLTPGGRLAVISFHSLEDRIVKTCFNSLVKIQKTGKILTKRPLTPGESELAENGRSRSAKLRVIERT